MTRWTHTRLFPQVIPLDDTPKTRRLTMMKTMYGTPRCHACSRTATHFSTLHKRFTCWEHLTKEDRKRLTMEWQWTHIVLPMQRHLDVLKRG